MYVALDRAYIQLWAALKLLLAISTTTLKKTLLLAYEIRVIYYKDY